MVLSLLLLLLLLLVLRHSTKQMCKSHCLRVKCPEVGLWLRQPFDDYNKQKPRIFCLTAKLGPSNGAFVAATQKQVAKAKHLGALPDSAKAFSCADLPREFVENPAWRRHVDSLCSRGGVHQPHLGRGGGCWLWKLLLLQRHLAELQDGDFLVCSDSDMLGFFSWLSLLLEASHGGAERQFDTLPIAMPGKRVGQA